MAYLPPNGPIPSPGVAGMTVTVGLPLLIALGLALALCVGAAAVIILAGRQRTSRGGVGRWPAVATSARGAVSLRRIPGASPTL
jgi:hypothetical protein